MEIYPKVTIEILGTLTGPRPIVGAVLDRVGATSVVVPAKAGTPDKREVRLA